MFKVTGTYYGNDFKGSVNTQLPNWENGAFKKSSGTHILVELENSIVMHGEVRNRLFLHGWTNGNDFIWGSCSVD